MVPMLIGGIVAIVVIVGVTIGVLLQRRSHDDVHSVEHYHRHLHTLEEMRSNPSRPGGNGDGRAAYPSQAFRAGSSTVRLTDPDKPLVPPVPPPPVPNPAQPAKFDDEGGGSVRPVRPGGPDAGANGDANEERAARESDAEDEAQSKDSAAAGVATTTTAASAIPTAPTKGEERAMHSIDHRPRRLGAPLAAIGAVMVLIVVLIVTGLHTTNSNAPHHGTATTVTTTSAATTHHSHGNEHQNDHHDDRCRSRVHAFQRDRARRDVSGGTGRLLAGALGHDAVSVGSRPPAPRARCSSPGSSSRASRTRCPRQAR